MWESAGLAGLRFGDANFILQDIDVPDWQTNQMITFEVDDLDGIGGRSARGRCQIGSWAN